MNKFDSPVEEHYNRNNLFERIMQLLEEKGVEPGNISRKDIAAIDEFHVRGAEVSLEIAEESGISKELKILDIGCGIGGPARMLAGDFGCKVTGIDLTREFIRTAGLLSELVGLQDLTDFIEADATKLPFEDETFDVAWTQHVQMNIKEKSKLYSEMKRVLKNGGLFIYYDIFSKGNGQIYFPVPWADEESMSFLFTIDELKKILVDLGFTAIKTKDQTEEAKKFFEDVSERVAMHGPQAMGIHILMENSAPEKLRNVFRSLTENKIELQSGIYKKN